MNVHAEKLRLPACYRQKNATFSPHIHRTWEAYFSPSLYGFPRLSPEDYAPIGPPSNDQLNYQDIDSNIARRKTKKAERFLKGIFDWIGGIFTGHYSKN